MSVSASFKEFLIEQMAGFGPVTIRPMFGGAGVMRDGLMFALIDDEVLYLKVDETSRAAFVAENLPPFVYSRKDQKIDMSYFRVPERCLDDADEMAKWCRVAYGAALKAAAKKKPRKKQQAIRPCSLSSPRRGRSRCKSNGRFLAGKVPSSPILTDRPFFTTGRLVEAFTAS